jgi:hypothetical protein
VYFDIFHFQQLWAKQLQAVNGFALRAARILAKSLVFSYPAWKAFQNAFSCLLSYV